MRALNGILFFPRGGSSHVARSLSAQLPAHGWDVRILSGSLPGGPGDAPASRHKRAPRPGSQQGGAAPVPSDGGTMLPPPPLVEH